MKITQGAPVYPRFVLFTLNRGGIADLPLRMRGHVQVLMGSPWVFLLVKLEGLKTLDLGDSKWSLSFFTSEDDARETVRTVWGEHDRDGRRSADVKATAWAAK